MATHKPKPGERLFPCSDSFYRRLLRAQLAALPEPFPIPVGFHTLRHSFAINLVYHGKDVRLIQRLLGHQQLKSTLIYTQVLTGELHHLLQDVQFT